MKKRMGGIDWQNRADLVCAILERVRDNPCLFEVEARRRGIAIEHLIAAAVISAIRERIETAQLRSADSP